MSFKKKLIYFFLFFFSFSIINGVCYFDFNLPNEGIDSSGVYTTTNNYNIFQNFYSNPEDIEKKYRYNLDDSVRYKIFYFYFLDRRLLPFTSNAACGGTTGNHPASPVNIPSSYIAGYTTHDLQGSSCVVSNSGEINVQDVVYGENLNINFNLKSNLNYFTKISNTTPIYAPEDLLRDYYYMKSNVKVELINADTNQVIQELANQDVLLKEYDKNYPLSIPISSLEVGNYKLRVTTDTSTEPKCDNGRAGTSTFESNIFSVSMPPISINLNIDKTLITSTTQNAQLSWTTINANKCDLIAINNLGNTVLNQLDVSDYVNGFRTATLLSNESYKTYTLTCENTDNGLTETKSTTLYLDSDGDSVPDEVPENTENTLLKDNCKFTPNPNQQDLNNNQVGDVCEDSDEDGILYYSPKTGDQLDFCPNEVGTAEYRGCSRYSVSCTDNSEILGSQTPDSNGIFTFYCGGSGDKIAIDNEFNSPLSRSSSVLVDFIGNFKLSCVIDRSLATDLEIGYCTYTENPKLIFTQSIDEDSTQFTRNLIKVNEDYNLVKYTDTNGVEYDLTLPEVNETNEKYIITIKNNVEISREKVDPVKVAREAHKIKNLKSPEEAQEFIDNTVRLMEKFDIIKNLTYDGISTKVKIKLQDIPQSERQNITIYQVVPKSQANSIDDIAFLSDGGGQRIIIDKDPIIGWYFNESGSSEEIEYEVEGDNEGGDIIITQEAILYNEGELIVNYRQSDCNSGEAQILEIDDLEDSQVYDPETSDRLYKICIAHITENLEANNLLSNSLHLFNYTNAGNLSFLKNSPIASHISVSNSTIYWDVRISDSNPDGTYSCIGSINDENSSLFGDCGYTNNRIWIHLGVDLTPPTTTVDIPYIAHTMNVNLNSKDNIGGVGFKELSYCIHSDSDSECEVGINGEQFGTTTQSQVSLSVTCSYDWECIKYLRYSAKDLDDNTEEIKSTPLKLLDKGSACQADCTAKPSPNRYLKECRNLNGCEYYPSLGEVGDSRGENVALLCDFLIDGSYVKFNESHDIQCPMGPFRKTKFVNEEINFLNSDCDDIITNEYPILFEGQSVIMNIISCVDY